MQTQQITQAARIPEQRKDEMMNRRTGILVLVGMERACVGRADRYPTYSCTCTRAPAQAICLKPSGVHTMKDAGD